MVVRCSEGIKRVQLLKSKSIEYTDTLDASEKTARFPPREPRLVTKYRYTFVTINTFLKCFARRREESRVTPATVHLRRPGVCSVTCVFPIRRVCAPAHTMPRTVRGH